VTMVVQVNGKVRDKMEVPAGVTKEQMEETARASAARAHLDGRDIVKVVIVPPKLINFVVR